MSNDFMGKDFDQLVESVGDLSKKILELNQQAVKRYTRIVDDIIRAGSGDVTHIEKTLDGLLDFCGFDSAFQLYRRLCRYYWDIDPNATAEYINIYRELWDSDPKKPQQKNE